MQFVGAFCADVEVATIPHAATMTLEDDRPFERSSHAITRPLHLLSKIVVLFERVPIIPVLRVSDRRHRPAVFPFSISVENPLIHAPRLCSETVRSTAAESSARTVFFQPALALDADMNADTSIERIMSRRSVNNAFPSRFTGEVSAMMPQHA